jgi:hypothetical protein
MPDKPFELPLGPIGPVPFEPPFGIWPQLPKLPSPFGLQVEPESMFE